MLNEVACNLFIKKLMGWGYKIPDSQNKNKTIRRPFDGFGVYDGFPIYYESKYFPDSFKKVTKKKLFNRKHQIENLILIHSCFEKRFGAIMNLTVQDLCLYCIFMRIASTKVKLFIIKNETLRDFYMSRKENQSYTIEEIEKASKGGTVLSTNLDVTKVNLWNLIYPEELT
jgi:hypothetical protein